NDFDNIDLSCLSQGVYIVKINLNEGYICTKKIIKK
ncbi:MAG: T9SS type A sorting domain-containing protein, partial [Bacteroidales bacterium]|nr:T9SS type A sorting domain-containing protein [Bacteroidales bacterium]